MLQTEAYLYNHKLRLQTFIVQATARMAREKHLLITHNNKLRLEKSHDVGPGVLYWKTFLRS
jgi:hypothetical protein